MLCIDIGGAKRFTETIIPWKVLDLKGEDYKYDLNSGQPFPLEDNSVDNYYTSHTLEHIDIKNLLFVFKEICRTLKQKGLVRIVVPNFEIGMLWYQNRNKLLFDKLAPGVPHHYPPTYLGRLTAWILTPNDHKGAFDKETLEWYLNTAGFVNIKKMKYDSHSAIFEGKDFIRYSMYSLYYEAQK